jgi:acetyl esterase/lipase
MGGTQNRFAVWGHSQGGQAALFTGLIAKSYAPELDLAGVAAAAPATELAMLLDDDIASSGGRNLTSMTLWSWSRLFGAPIDRVVDPVRCRRSIFSPKSASSRSTTSCSAAARPVR